MSMLLGLGLVMAAPASGTPLSWNLTATNGEGTFDDTIACPAGDGPSWRYAYSGVATTSGPLTGTWNSTVEVHDAGGGDAFVPPGTGRIKITADRGGEGNLEFGNGGCALAPLDLFTELDGDPAISGTQPALATGGSGTLRGFTGSATVTMSTLELGAGADNVADISVSGDFTVTQPNMVLGSPTPYWRNVSEFLHHRLTVTVPLRNLDDPPGSVGDAYAVQLTKARLSGRVPVSGVPASLGRIDAGKMKAVSVVFPNAQANKTYTLKVWIDGKDALDDPFPTVIDADTLKSPPPP
jgi:hypothetical protein